MLQCLVLSFSHIPLSLVYDMVKLQVLESSVMAQSTLNTHMRLSDIEKKMDLMIKLLEQQLVKEKNSKPCN